MSSITRFLPKNHLSYLVGQIVHIRLPSFIWAPIIRIFSKAYNINLDEAEKPVSDYPSLGEFFVRKLKPGIRPLGTAWALHPADSLITQSAKITDGKLIQAKNKTYNVVEFTQDPKALEKYNNGHFLTYYLCPTDYHRVHAPVTGTIRRVVHIPGALWPVNQWSTDHIHELFSVNERVVVEIETEKGLVAAVFVAATNVGQIELSFDADIRGNQLVLSKPLVKDNLNISIQKGDELGMFRMGSTVVMLYQGGTLGEFEASAFQNQTVRVNSSFV